VRDQAVVARDLQGSGRAVAALMTKWLDLFSKPPSAEKIDVLAAKLPDE
jgi:hypothetical protein